MGNAYEYQMALNNQLRLDEGLARSGAIISAVGVVLLVAFLAVLLLFPVIRDCGLDTSNCTYTSTAPGSFKSIIQPAYLALALATIAGGVLMLRFGRWRESKKSGIGA